MSRREPYESKRKPESDGAKLFWKSLESKQNPAEAKVAAESEFMPGAVGDVVKPKPEDAKARLSRRGFLGFGAATAALMSEACIRRPVEKILPYTKAPEHLIPGVSSYYATIIPVRGEVIGALVESHEGRPTKIEGNIDHPMSVGGADLLMQASVMDLYDTDRSPMVRQGGERSDAKAFDAAMASVLKDAAADGGARVRVLLAPTVSPTVIRLRELVKQRFPHLRFHTYTSVPESNSREGARISFGQQVSTLCDFAAAKVVLSLDADFLLAEQGSIRASRGFAKARKIEKPTDAMSRLYVVESTTTITGANADHRLRLPARDIDAYARALALELATAHGVDLGAVKGALGTAQAPAGVDAKWVKSVAKDLAANKGSSLVVAGRRQPPHVHALVNALNTALDNVGVTVTYTPVADTLEPVDLGADLRALTDDMEAGKVDALFILGGNPVYDAPGDVKLGERLKKVKTSIHLSATTDETTEAVTWHVPMAHELECWGDGHSLDGSWSIQQPLILPLYEGRSIIELLAVLADLPAAHASGHELVRDTFRESAATPALFDSAWNAALRNGLVLHSNSVRFDSRATTDDVATALGKAKAPVGALGPDNLEVVFAACPKIHDGRHGNNPWLLELPDPMTKIVWDNAALVSPQTAKALGLEAGDLVALSREGATEVQIAVWVQPGMPDNSLTLSLGWGRKNVGRYGNGTGFDVHPLRSSASLDFVSGVKLRKLGITYKIVQTQDHDSMEGRPLAIDTTLDEYRDNPEFVKYRSPTPKTLPLWDPIKYEGHKWGMTIDLNACTGCNACVVACIAENNIAFVGKNQVFRGREMHWIRVDRYYVGADSDSPEVAFQPVACVQCEEAPCENVCPVNATAHSPEGLNDMSYNRCIGTRYCANNCPYKVRRFNFLSFRGPNGAEVSRTQTYDQIPETEKMQFNPNVTVRMRGVMEKCTYCVQRIEEAKIASRRENRSLGPKDIVTACQQTCPAEAITFGDLNDAKADVARLAKIDRAYALLAEVGTRPRTQHLGKIRNPNKEMS